MDIDSIIRQAQKQENADSGFFVEQDGKKRPLTVREASETMERVIYTMSRSMAVTYLKEEHHTSFPDIILDDMAKKYIDKAMKAIPILLMDIVKTDLTVKA